MVSALMQMTIDGSRVVLINEPKNFGQSDKYNRVNYWTFLSFWFGCFKYTSSVLPEIILCMMWIHHRKMSSGSKWIKVKREHKTNGREEGKVMHARKSVGARERRDDEVDGVVEMKDFCLQQYNLTRVTYTFETDATLWNDCFRFPLHMDEEQRCAFTVNKM